MKLVALLVALIALGGSVYTMLMPFKDYEDANRDWSSMDTGNPNYDSLSAERNDLRGLCQTLVMAVGAAAVLGLILGVIAQRKKGGFVPVLAILLSLGAAGPLGYMLIEGVF